MAQVNIVLETFSFRVLDSKTLIIDLGGGGFIQLSFENDMSALTEAIGSLNNRSAEAEMRTPMMGTSSTRGQDDTSSSGSDGSSAGVLEDELNSALDSLRVAEESFDEEAETQNYFY